MPLTKREVISIAMTFVFMFVVATAANIFLVNWPSVPRLIISFILGIGCAFILVYRMPKDLNNA